MTAFRIAALGLLVIASAAEAQTRGGQAQAAQNQASPAPNSQTRTANVPVPQPMREKQFPVGVSYIAVSLNGRPFSGERPALVLDQTFRLKGFGGCNNYSATAYPLREQGLAVGPFALTKRDCDRGRMELERSFLVVLRTAQKWDVSGSTLTIKGPNGELKLERSL